jgi:iron complex transport system ATP-binding protein
MPALEIREVSHTAGGRRLLDRVSWRVERGEHWAVLGPNGAGKTTLLKIACGYLWPNAGGEVLRDGEATTDLREMRRRIGWVSSVLTRQIPPREKALDTIVSGKFAQTGLMVMHWDRPRADDYARAEALLAEMDSLDLRDKPFGVLSQGEQQKVLIARARMTEPLLVILDEPCAGLDPAAREKLLAALTQIAARPAAPSLILVTHHIEEIVPAFAHALALRDGRVARSGPTRQIIDARLVRDLYGAEGAELIDRHGRLWPVW